MENLEWITFVLLALASFRLTRLLVYDQITSFIRRPFLKEWSEINEEGEKEVYYQPKESGIRGWIGELLSCYWCTGFWSTLILYAGNFFYEELFFHVIVILAIAGVASIIETLVQTLRNDL